MKEVARKVKQTSPHICSPNADISKAIDVSLNFIKV